MTAPERTGPSARQAAAPRRDASAGLVKTLAHAWGQIAWRDGSNTPLTSRCARLRVRPAHDDAKRNTRADEEWLLIEWPEGETEPDHYWLSTLPADTSFEHLVDLTKMRWRTERDYLEPVILLQSLLDAATIPNF